MIIYRVLSNESVKSVKLSENKGEPGWRLLISPREGLEQGLAEVDPSARISETGTPGSPLKKDCWDR